jgi:hypothetical protein
MLCSPSPLWGEGRGEVFPSVLIRVYFSFSPFPRRQAHWPSARTSTASLIIFYNWVQLHAALAEVFADAINSQNFGFS